MRPGVKRVTPTGAEFNDGEQHEFDKIVFATGYHRELPFTVNGSRFNFPEQPLYRYTFSPRHRNLAFCLFMHSVGSFQVAWMQAKWISSVMVGRCSLPPRQEMEASSRALSVHQGKDGLDPFDTQDMFASGAPAARREGRARDAHDRPRPRVEVSHGAALGAVVPPRGRRPGRADRDH
eukprot:CAMPEP_0177621976 /NCGR_PEP_ID=MMETSP0419_2-20121207/27958_1 /TAXON_ID=582737 /ORGANISM="Tetraselmis sp., Strain GSL018" /LENGTH=177 /DNA_ID=CAMNT_0019122101 /DNA_START=538 /DNA_END=1068 /DNA_ORIENTATION=+